MLSVELSNIFNKPECVHLMYRDEVIAELTGDNNLIILNKNHPVVERYSLPQNALNFFSDRIISKSRKGIESVINRLNIVDYDVMAIARHTRAINPMDNFWLRYSDTETFSTFYFENLNNLFNSTNLVSPESVGQNQKYYAKQNGKLGIVKKRLLGVTFDTESELAVDGIANLLGISVCPTTRVSKDLTFSEFMYDPFKESITHVRHLVVGEIDYDEPLLPQLISIFPLNKQALLNMAILDCLTAQDDRHLSNLALKDGTLYPLYDNGRSLFWEFGDDVIEDAISNPLSYLTTFGEVSTYYDSLCTEQNYDLSCLSNLRRSNLKRIMLEAGFVEHRSDLLVKWVLVVKELLLNKLS